MGKVVLAIVTVAVFVAIAVFAPEISPAIFGVAFGTTATAIAITTAVLSIAAGAALGILQRALVNGSVGSAPQAKFTAAPVGTAAVGVFGSVPKRRLQSRMDIIRGSLRHRAYRAWFGRFQLFEFVGDCLFPTMTDRYGVADFDADLRRGDLMSFSVRDVKTAFPDYGTTGITKRFIGLDVENGILRFDCTNPRRTIETSLDNVLYAHRVRATAPTLKEARRLFKEVRRNPDAFDAPLMPTDGKPHRSNRS